VINVANKAEDCYFIPDVQVNQILNFHFVVRNGVLCNGTAQFKNVKNYLNTNIYSYLETSGGQSSNLYLNAVQFFNASVN
jgi:hypothetical protein